MDYLSAAALGAALAADASAAAMTSGIKNNGYRLKGALLTGGSFAVFQTIMPVLGWSIGKVGGGFFDRFDHIAAFGILVFLGVKMLYDFRTDKTVGVCNSSIKELLVLSAATSIDALAAGVALPAAVGADSPIKMLNTVLIIGGVTFVMSVAGYYLGGRLRRFHAGAAGAAGGIVLIVLGVKTLLAG